jgi:hypothetical protein
VHCGLRHQLHNEKKSDNVTLNNLIQQPHTLSNDVGQCSNVLRALRLRPLHAIQPLLGALLNIFRRVRVAEGCLQSVSPIHVPFSVVIRIAYLQATSNVVGVLFTTGLGRSFDLPTIVGVFENLTRVLFGLLRGI